MRRAGSKSTQSRTKCSPRRKVATPQQQAITGAGAPSGALGVRPPQAERLGKTHGRVQDLLQDGDLVFTTTQGDEIADTIPRDSPHIHAPHTRRQASSAPGALAACTHTTSARISAGKTAGNAARASPAARTWLMPHPPLSAFTPASALAGPNNSPSRRGRTRAANPPMKTAPAAGELETCRRRASAQSAAHAPDPLMLWKFLVSAAANRTP